MITLLVRSPLQGELPLRNLIIGITLFVSAAFPMKAQIDFSQVTIEVTHVAGNVWMVTGAGGNIGLSIGEDGVILIDDQYAPLAPRIEKAIREVTDQPLRFILNTHHHGDHVGGNLFFGRQAPIVAQKNVRRRLAAATDSEAGALPVLTYQDGVVLHLNGEEARVFHLPHAHTDGDSVIYFTESNVVHTGDLFFNGRFPFIDLDSGGSVRGLIAAIDTLLTRLGPETRVIPGHGPLATVDELRSYAGMLRETSTIVLAAKREGKSAQQIKDESLLSEYEHLSWNFIPTSRYIDILYRDLQP
jgi:cyclase